MTSDMDGSLSNITKLNHADNQYIYKSIKYWSQFSSLTIEYTEVIYNQHVRLIKPIKRILSR